MGDWFSISALQGWTTEQARCRHSLRVYLAGANGMNLGIPVKQTNSGTAERGHSFLCSRKSISLGTAACHKIILPTFVILSHSLCQMACFGWVRAQLRQIAAHLVRLILVFFVVFSFSNTRCHACDPASQISACFQVQRGSFHFSFPTYRTSRLTCSREIGGYAFLVEARRHLSSSRSTTRAAMEHLNERRGDSEVDGLVGLAWFCAVLFFVSLCFACLFGLLWLCVCGLVWFDSIVVCFGLLRFA